MSSCTTPRTTNSFQTLQTTTKKVILAESSASFLAGVEIVALTALNQKNDLLSLAKLGSLVTITAGIAGITKGIFRLIFKITEDVLQKQPVTQALLERTKEITTRKALAEVTSALALLILTNPETSLKTKFVSCLAAWVSVKIEHANLGAKSIAERMTTTFSTAFILERLLIFHK